MNDHETTDAVFASYNIHKCVGSDRRFDPERIEDVIAEIGADVIALQETDRRFGARDALLDMDSIHRKTGLVPVEVKNGHNGHGWHGNLLLVREAKVSRLTQIDLPGHEPRGALVADVELKAGHVRVVAAHLGLLRLARLAQIARLVAAAHHEVEHPIVLMGDLNEWRRQKRSALHAFTPGFGLAGIGVPSFPAYYPMLALDRILARPSHILGGVEAHDTPLSRRASDHLPIKTRVRLGKQPSGGIAGADAMPTTSPATR
jgi:endonuclease/exonuclease/phosphatase family metal-dependent hydrolase